MVLDWEDPLGEEMATTAIFLPGKSHGQRSLQWATVCRIRKSQTRQKQLNMGMNTCVCLYYSSSKFPTSLFFSKIYFIEVQFIYNVVLISAVQQNKLVIYNIFIFFSIMVYYKILNIVPSRFLFFALLFNIINLFPFVMPK